MAEHSDPEQRELVHSDFQVMEALVSAVLSRIQAQAGGSDDSGGGRLLRDGINDIYFKLSCGDAKLELEISAAKKVHRVRPIARVTVWPSGPHRT